MEKIGLNNAWRSTKGMSFPWRIRNLFWELRYAWRRAWRGYDDVEIFDLGFSFFRRMPMLLRQFKTCNISLFYDDEHDRDMTEEETDAVDVRTAPTGERGLCVIPTPAYPFVEVPTQYFSVESVG